MTTVEETEEWWRCREDDNPFGLTKTQMRRVEGYLRNQVSIKEPKRVRSRTEFMNAIFNKYKNGELFEVKDIIIPTSRCFDINNNRISQWLRFDERFEIVLEKEFLQSANGHIPVPSVWHVKEKFQAL